MTGQRGVEQGAGGQAATAATRAGIGERLAGGARGFRVVLGPTLPGKR